MIYSGYKIGHLKRRYEWIGGMAAAVVDGGFERGNETDLCWKGSANQTVTVFRPDFAERYSSWEREKKGRLQLLRKSDRLFVAGIPRQSDAEKIRGM